MTKEEAQQLIDETFPSVVDGVSRPTDYIAVDMPYNEDMPYDVDDLIARRQVVRDKINELQTQAQELEEENSKAVTD